MRTKRGGDLSGDADPSRLTRRQALWHGAAGLAVVCSFDKLASVSSAPSGKSAPVRRSEVSGLFDPFQAELPIPRVLEPLQEGGIDKYEITMRDDMTTEILPGLETPIAAYDGEFPGPTIRARVGRPVEVTHTNDLDSTTTVHLHGGHQQEVHDGALHEYYIPPGEERTYHYPNEQPHATLWYHDHIHGATGPHLNYGLLGAYLLESEADANRGLPQDEYDVPLVITDRSFNDDGSFNYSESLFPGFRGDTILVNGAIVPRMRVKRRLYRLRFLNASNARAYRLVLGQKRIMHQIASDGGLIERPRNRRSLLLTSAERAEVLVDFRQFRPGSKLILRNTLGGQTTSAVMRFDVEGGGGAEEFRVPNRLSWPEPTPPPRRTRDFTLDFDGSEWVIDGKGFDPDRIDERPYLHTTERWRFVNAHAEHSEPHPMHLHGCHFKVISINGEAPHPGDQGWKDTVNVPPGGTAEIEPYFKPWPGRFVYHCHIVEHGDKNMMGLMEIRE